MTSRKIGLPVFLLIVGIMGTSWVFEQFMSPHSFLATPEEDLNISIDKEWDEYQEDLERRNQIKLNRSYVELMKLGIDFTQKRNFHDAAACYYFAKSIYPDREEPRRFLSQAYINLCAHHGEYCGDAKKEVYFAFRYIPDSSMYYSDILDMATALDLYPYLDMHETDVLPIFFEEQAFNSF